MADKTYRLLNMPNTTTAEYNTCLTATGGDVVKALVLLSDEVLRPLDQDADVEANLCAHISTLVHEWGAMLVVNGTEFEMTVDETIGDEIVTDGYAEEIT